MTSIGHIAITSLARNNPLTSLAWGCVSHIILDKTCSEYKLESLSAKHLVPYILWQGMISIAFLLYTGYWWALLGLLPDVIEGGYIFIKGIKVWNSGELLFWFHRPNSKPIWSKRLTQVVEIILITIIIISI